MLCTTLGDKFLSGISRALWGDPGAKRRGRWMGDVAGCQVDVSGMGLDDTELFPGSVTQ